MALSFQEIKPACEIADFFERARQAAHHADQGQALSDTLTLTFEDPRHGVQKYVQATASRIEIMTVLA
jgi:hypothetical protein